MAKSDIIHLNDKNKKGWYITMFNLRRPKTNENEKDSIVEKCVLCKSLTPYTKDTPIQRREYYVVGAGQLCQKCWEGLETSDRK